MINKENSITWDFAKERYKVSYFSLEQLSFINPNLSDRNLRLVINLWENKYEKHK